VAEYICKQCGVQFAESAVPPAACPICLDDRQYVNWDGQQWTTLAELGADHSNRVEAEGPHIYGVGTEPSVAIGQRALLVQSPGGNVLWDCMSYIDTATIERVRELGGISAIAISHPHFYGAMVAWSRAFDHAPIYLHAADKEWVMQPDPAIVHWDGDTYSLHDGLTLVRGGIHFPGGTVLHWPAGAGGRGALLTGDIFAVVPDRRYTSFMYSFPNFIPEHPDAIRAAVERMEQFDFDVIYGGWWKRVTETDAKENLRFSMRRYLRHIGHAE
jgi:hypothetical protein